MINAFEPGGTDFLRNIEEGYISYLAPVGKGLQIDFGKFTTPIGAEVIEAKDNWNYSRSLLFALAIPYYHTGLRLTYAPTSKVSVMGLVVNGWNNVVENNSGKTYRRAGQREAHRRIVDRAELHGRPRAAGRHRRLAAAVRHDRRRSPRPRR